MRRLRDIIGISDKLFKEDKKLIIWAIILTLVTTVTSRLILPFAMQYVFGAIEAYDLTSLYIIIGIIIVVVIALLILSFVFYVYADAWFVVVANKGISVMVKQLHELPYGKVNALFSEGEIYNRISDGGIASTHVYNVGSRFAATMVSCLVLIVASLLITPWLAAFILIISIFDILRFRYEWFKRTAFIEELKTHESKLEESIYDIVENSSFYMLTNTSRYVCDGFKETRSGYWSSHKKLINLRSLLDTISSFYYALSRAVLSFILISGPVASLVATFAIFDSYRVNNQELRNHMVRFPLFFKSIDRMRELLSTENQAPQEKVIRDNLEISVENLSYSYDEQEIFQKLNFKIHANEKIALVGANGSGKTTLIRLLLGMYEPTEGSISIGGKNPVALAQEEKRSLIGYAPIDSQMFSESIFRNLEMGASEQSLPYDDAIAALADVSFEVSKETLLEQTASSLSGGETARVNVVRAQMHKPKIIIADEPLASIDKESERKVLSKLLSLNCTLIVTIHDEEYLDMFDRTIRLQGEAT
jgi:ABC-type bacteriocin/lantibiotic exporter with double-glycine peptidase domain